MKYKILIVFILFASLNKLYCQNQRAIIYLKNGDTIRGLAKITIKNKVNFRKEKTSQMKILDYKEIKKIKINENGIRKEYLYKIAKTGNTSAKAKLMSLIISGKISLYKINSNESSHGFASTDDDGTSSFVVDSSIFVNDFYFGELNSDLVENLSANKGLPIFGKSFIKNAFEYFKKCKKIVTLIKNKTFTKNDLQEIVEFYNENCE